jgi:hypothetical protein
MAAMAAGGAMDVVIHVPTFTSHIHSHTCVSYIINTIY